MQQPPARITIHRLGHPINDLFRAYWVIVDGANLGSIRRRRTRTFTVPAGHHEVHLKIDWCRSRSIEADLRPGQELKLVCKARPLTRWNWIFKDDYMKLDYDSSGRVDSKPS